MWNLVLLKCQFIIFAVNANVAMTELMTLYSHHIANIGCYKGGYDKSYKKYESTKLSQKINRTRTTIVVSIADILFIKYTLSNTIYQIPFIIYHL